MFYSKPDLRLQESTQSEAIVDPLEGEQTWPTDEEMAQAEEEEELRRKAASADEESRVKVVKRVPKGTSEYQAAWIMDEDQKAEKEEKKQEDVEEEDDDDDDEDEEDAMSEDDDKLGSDAGRLREFGRCDEEIDDDDEDDEEDDNDNDDDEEYENISVGTDKDAKYDEGMDQDEDRANLEKMRKEKKTQVLERGGRIGVLWVKQGNF